VQQVDYIILGQGLAGSCLALRLLMRGRKVAVIDAGHPHAASRVAAGLFNPITGKTPGLTWMAHELFHSLRNFYAEAEKFTGATFFYPMPVYRPFLSIAEQNEWAQKASWPGVKPFIKKIHYQPAYADEVVNPLGGIEIEQSGYLNTVVFLQAVRNTLTASAVFLNEHVNERELHFADDFIQYKGLHAQKLVCCTGAFANTLFEFLPIHPLKGEVLKLQTHHYPQCIYNRGVYVVPGIWKAGATYARADNTPTVTQTGRAQLEQGLQALIRFPYQIVGQDYGFRPTTPDRRPLLGQHPQHPNLYIFNGLGTKGVTLAPYFSAQLVDFMENEGALNQMVDVKRYIIH
jgi:glycine/D-amino acid oxidase-like deaminating enzyme